ncbi:MAG: trehalose-6-phosphate synthase, partial [Deltaproteobacteria bacterium]|nr:trehalose-6-phosphate synthase [Deltaproteobacteria bacterium]
AREGGWTASPGSGGLVTAIAPVLQNRGGLWIGWPGTVDEGLAEEDLAAAMDQAAEQSGFDLTPVMLTEEEKNGFYYGFSNEVLWPLFHDLVKRCNFLPEYWPAYRRVNKKFARKIKEKRQSNDYVWVHDYHLMGVGEALRQLGVEDRIGFFLHIPFPSPDIFARLPWRFEILRALLHYDMVGFQTMRDRRNFTHCVRTFVPGVAIHGRGAVVTFRFRERDVRVGAFPISIDFNEFAEAAATKEVSDLAWEIHEQLSEKQIILGVDRLDYTKGIPERLRAYRYLLENYPDLHEKVVFVQVVVPSRADIPEYRDLKAEIEGLVSEINGMFTRCAWVPVHYQYRSLSREELIAYYRTSEMALITPLKDGMNLIAKEFCASSLEPCCVLILSEFAGAAAQFQRGALLVNPHDQEGIAKAIHKAFHMPHKERVGRMKRLRAAVKRHDIYEWVNSFLQASFARKLESFPAVEDYTPRMSFSTGGAGGFSAFEEEWAESA